MFTITKTRETYDADFGIRKSYFTIPFKTNRNLDFLSISDELIKIFTKFIDDCKKRCKKQDKLRMVFMHDDFNTPISIPFMPYALLDPMLILNEFEKVCQSVRTVKINNGLTCEVTFLHMPQGAGNKVPESVLELAGLCIVDNSDNMCLLRSILIGKTYWDGDAGQRRKYTTLGSKAMEDQIRRFKRLIPQLSQVKMCGVPELLLIENVLVDYQVTVFSTTGKLIVSGNPEYEKVDGDNFLQVKKEKFIYIALDEVNDHYHAITSLPAFLLQPYCCHLCKTAWNHSGAHKCDAVCHSCRRTNCCREDKDGTGVEKLGTCVCHSDYYNEDCKRIHSHSVCTVLNRCSVCYTFKKKGTVHVCLNQKYCSNCKKADDRDSHRCFVSSEEPANPSKSKDTPFNGYIIFDYESMIIDRKHHPAMVCILKVCALCLDHEDESCTVCEYRRFDSNDEFNSWLFKQKHFVCIAHNASSYDSVFISNYILKNTTHQTKTPSYIMRGSKIMSIKWKGVKIIDSLLFFSMSLDNLTKALNIEAAKGFYPYSFYLPENRNYVGPYPSKDFYDTKNLSESRLAEFHSWYDSVKHETFDLDAETEKYCRNDVEILKKCVLIFRSLFSDI